MQTVLKANKNISHHVIIGDSNIDTLNSESEYLDNFLENKYISYVNTITRPSTNNESGSRLWITLWLNQIKMLLHVNYY